MRLGQGGQVLVGVLVITLILALLIPAMVLFVQNEAKWSVKQQKNITAFQLAEGALDRGFRKISESTSTWQSAQDGVFPAGYAFDTSYGDLSGGCYAINISSGPDPQQVTILAVGTDSMRRETRSIRGVFANAVIDVAVHADGSLAITGNNFQLEWGAAVTPKSITVGSRLHPQYYSAGSIDLDANGSAPPNCDSPDCVFWFSYYPNVPLQPDVDFDFYRASAQATGTYYANDVSLGNILDTTGKTYFFEKNLNVTSSGGNHYIVGNLIVMGNLTTANGNVGTGTETVSLPRTAWKQYAKDWAFYRTTYDAAAPAAFPGLNSTYLSSPSLTYTISNKVFVHGFMYVGGEFTTGSGGGNFALVGTAYVKGNVTLNTNSQGRLYYNADVANQVKNTTIALTRASWRDALEQPWPSGLSCP